MFIFIAIIVLLALIKVKFCKHNQDFFSDYLSIDKTTAIKGLFILLIFCTHSEQYISIGTGLLADLYYFIRLALGQSVVTAFLFYSGYGIYESIKRKGDNYIKTFPRQRMLKVLIHFDIAVLIFAIISIVTNNIYEPLRYLLSLIGYYGIGNSNWFIFDILVAYLIVYLSFSLFKDKRSSLWCVTFLSIIFILLMIKYQESRFYNTFITFAIGMWYSYYRNEIEQFLLKSKLRYWLIIVCLIAIYGIGGYLLIDFYEAYEFLYIPLPVVFVIALVFITMRVSIYNKILLFFGKISFSLFILMRIPMNLMEHFGYTDNQYIFTIICFIVAVPMAYLYDKLLQVIDNKLFKKSV